MYALKELSHRKKNLNWNTKNARSPSFANIANFVEFTENRRRIVDYQVLNKQK